jgi:hypothetical protein
MDSLRASAQGLEIVERSRRNRRWTKAAEAWCQDAYTTKASLRRFWRRVPISRETFIAICNAIGVNWTEIADEEVILTRRQDWGEAPDISVFYGRTEERATLEQSIVENRCRLVALWGIGGIGKTALSVKLAQQVWDKFEYVIWRSLRYAQPIEELLADLIEFVSDEQETNHLANVNFRVSRLIEYLRQHRCLLILDAWETVLQSGELVGPYREGFEEYGELLKRVGEVGHSSCLVLTSREKPKEIAELEGTNYPVRSFKLKSLGEAAREIFRGNGFSDEDDWEKLISAYRGNPLALKMVSTTIQDLFGGCVSEFLNNSLFLGDIEYLLAEHFQRLSQLEKEIVCCLAIAREPVSCSQLREGMRLEVSTSELIAALQSLERRAFIETVKEGNETLFTLPPVVMKYASKQCH